VKRLSLAVAVVGLFSALPADGAPVHAPWPHSSGSLVLSPPPLIQDEEALRDVYVLPTRPGQNRVAYWSHDWQVHEFKPERGGGGVKLFFYAREREAARYAAAAIGESYERLTDRFHYLPRTSIPFILYASSSEFLATHGFFGSEGTLGATDPRDLRMAQPFFGNVRQFARVATHEMVHQFTIQKVRDSALAAGTESPLLAMPLWFIEGLAEYGSLGGMDPEGDYILRDLMTNPDPMRGYALPHFFDAMAGGYIGVYKLGQARVTFISETYGHDKVIELLERSAEMMGAPPQPPEGEQEAPKPAEEPGESDVQKTRASVTEVTAEFVVALASPDEGAVSDDPKAGTERDAKKEEGEAEPDADANRAEGEGESVPDAKTAEDPGTDEKKADAETDGEAEEQDSPQEPPDERDDAISRPEEAGGAMPQARAFQTYMARVLGDSPERIDARYQEWLKRRYFREYLQSVQTVAAFAPYTGLAGEPDSITASDDGTLLLYRTGERETGLATLHLQDVRDPTSRVVVARDQRPNIESLHPVDRRVTTLCAGKLAFTARAGRADVIYVVPFTKTEDETGRRIRVELDLGDRERFDLGEILEVYDPALSPDGREVAFAAVDPSGFRDLYVLTIEGPARGDVRRLTTDVWSEADLHWDGGRLLYVSDRTETKEPNVFALDLSSGESERLTFHKEEDRHPIPALGGIVFRSLRSGKPDLWLLKDGNLQRLTDTPSAMLMAVPSTKKALLSLVFHKGEYRLYRIPKKTLLQTELQPAQPAVGVGGSGLSAGLSLRYPSVDIPGKVQDYNPMSSSNWRLEATAAALVGPTSAGAAALAVTDVMRDHVMLVNLAIYGSLKLTDALAFYINQSRRPELGAGVFHTFEPRRDKTFPDELNYYLQREFGVGGLIRYPFDRFRRAEASLEIRGIERFSYTDYSGEYLDEWEELNGGIEPELVFAAMVGRDTMRLHALAGPIDGSSLMLSGSVGYLPMRQTAYLRLLGDAQQRFRIAGRTSFLLRASAGGTSRGRFSPQFYLSSVGNMEGYRFGDDRLLGDYFYVANARLTFPIDDLIRVPLFTGIFAVSGLDFGAAFDEPSTAWDHRSLSAVLGADVALGAMVLQLHFGRLVNVGGDVGSEPWVFNLGLRYLYY